MCPYRRVMRPVVAALQPRIVATTGRRVTATHLGGGMDDQSCVYVADELCTELGGSNRELKCTGT